MTFVEIVVAVVLIAVVVVPVLTAVATSIRTSSVSRVAAEVETVLVNAVDRANRADRGNFPCDLSSPVRAAVETHGWPASSATIGHEYLDAAGAWQTDATGTACPEGEFRAGIVQRVTVTVTSPTEDISRTLQVVKSDI